MLIPVKAGGSFYIEPNGSEDFTGKKNDSIRRAAGLYLESMLFGLQLCKKDAEVATGRLVALLQCLEVHFSLTTSSWKMMMTKIWS